MVARSYVASIPPCRNPITVKLCNLSPGFVQRSTAHVGVLKLVKSRRCPSQRPTDNLLRTYWRKQNTVWPVIKTNPQHIIVLANIMASGDTTFTLKLHMIFQPVNMQTLATEDGCRLLATKRNSFPWSRNGMVAMLNQLKTSKPLGNFETYLCTCAIEIRNK